MCHHRPKKERVTTAAVLVTVLSAVPLLPLQKKKVWRCSSSWRCTKKFTWLPKMAIKIYIAIGCNFITPRTSRPLGSASLTSPFHGHLLTFRWDVRYVRTVCTYWWKRLRMRKRERERETDRQEQIRHRRGSFKTPVSSFPPKYASFLTSFFSFFGHTAKKNLFSLQWLLPLRLFVDVLRDFWARDF